jgi:hypothetical protein
MEFFFRNVNHAIRALPLFVRGAGRREMSRNGPVISLDVPLTLTTLKPLERVLLCPKRRANPFLFLLDGLSILSSVDFVRPLADIAPRFMNYSDDGVRLRGHYGKRLHWQIPSAVEMLLNDPTSRRATMAIWNPSRDLADPSVDIPCNVHVNLRIVRGELDLTVMNRSNDVFWGLLGANIVQFSFLQEYIATMLNVPVGRLYQVTTNAHIYTEFGPGRADDYDFSMPSETYPPVLPLDVEFLPSALNLLFLRLNDGEVPDSSGNRFVSNVVLPMLQAWKHKDPKMLNVGFDCDWFEAGRMYLSGVK